MQQRCFGTSSILAAWAFLEALVNEVWRDASDAVSGHPHAGIRHSGLESSVMPRFVEQVERQRSRTLDKYQIALVSTDKAKFERGKEPYKSVDSIRMLRNALMHATPEIQWGDQETKLQQRLAGKFEGNPLVDGYPWYPPQVLVAGCAEWCWRSCLDFAELWWQRMGLEFDFKFMFAHWPDPATN
jgi:hypothetical protein